MATVFYQVGAHELTHVAFAGSNVEKQQQHLEECTSRGTWLNALIDMYRFNDITNVNRDIESVP